MVEHIQILTNTVGHVVSSIFWSGGPDSICCTLNFKCLKFLWYGIRLLIVDIARFFYHIAHRTCVCDSLLVHVPVVGAGCLQVKIVCCSCYSSVLKFWDLFLRTENSWNKRYSVLWSQSIRALLTNLRTQGLEISKSGTQVQLRHWTLWEMFLLSAKCQPSLHV